MDTWLPVSLSVPGSRGCWVCCSAECWGDANFSDQKEVSYDWIMKRNHLVLVI